MVIYCELVNHLCSTEDPGLTLTLPGNSKILVIKYLSFLWFIISADLLLNINPEKAEHGVLPNAMLKPKEGTSPHILWPIKIHKKISSDTSKNRLGAALL